MRSTKIHKRMTEAHRQDEFAIAPFLHGARALGSRIVPAVSKFLKGRPKIPSVATRSPRPATSPLGPEKKPATDAVGRETPAETDKPQGGIGSTIGNIAAYNVAGRVLQGNPPGTTDRDKLLKAGVDPRATNYANDIVKAYKDISETNDDDYRPKDLNDPGYDTYHGKKTTPKPKKKGKKQKPPSGVRITPQPDFYSPATHS
jgi:hypothetical protein